MPLNTHMAMLALSRCRLFPDVGSFQVCFCHLHCQLASTPGLSSELAREGKRGMYIRVTRRNFLTMALFISQSLFTTTFPTSQRCLGCPVGLLFIRKQDRVDDSVNSWESENAGVGEKTT